MSSSPTLESRQDAQASGRGDGALALALLAVMVLEVSARASGWGLLRAAGHGAMLLVVLVALPRLGLREAYLLSLSAALTGLLLWL